jgi:hypothetical protein
MARWAARAAEALGWRHSERSRRDAIRRRLAGLPAGGYSSATGSSPSGRAAGEQGGDRVERQGGDAAFVATRRGGGGEQRGEDGLLRGLDGRGEPGVEGAAADRGTGGGGGPVPAQPGREREEDLPGPVVTDGAGPGEP